MQIPHDSPIMENPIILDLRLDAEPVICWCDPEDYGTRVYCDCSFSGDPEAEREIQIFISEMEMPPEQPGFYEDRNQRY